MSFSVELRRLRPRVLGSGRWPQPRDPAPPGIPRAAVARSCAGCATARRSLEASATRRGLARGVRRTAAATRSCFRPVPGAAHRGALVDRARTRRSTSRPPTPIRFFDNHGMLGFRRKQWRTVVGGSHQYVARSPARFGDRLHLGCGVRAIRRDADGVERAHRRRPGAPVRRRRRRHPRRPGARPARGRRRPDERDVLGAFAYTRERHGAAHRRAFLPARRGARSSWNYRVDDCERRRPADRHLLPQPPAGPRRDRALLRHAEPRRDDRPSTVLAPRRRSRTRSTRRDASPPRRGLPRLAGRRPHALRRRVPRQRLPRGRAGLAASPPRRRSECRGERSALYVRHADARPPRRPARNVFTLTGLRTSASTSTSCPSLERRLRALRSNGAERRRRSATATTSTARPPAEAGGRSTSLADPSGRPASGCSPSRGVLGYVFNPVSFFWFYRADGSLACVVAEINNTFGERLPGGAPPAAELARTCTPRGCTSRRSSASTRRYRVHLPAARRRPVRARSRSCDDGARTAPTAVAAPAGGSRSRSPRSCASLARHPLHAASDDLADPLGGAAPLAEERAVPPQAAVRPGRGIRR